MKSLHSILIIVTLVLTSGCMGTLFDDSETFYNKDISITISAITPSQGSTILDGTEVSITADYIVDGWYTDCRMSLNVYGPGREFCQCTDITGMDLAALTGSQTITHTVEGCYLSEKNCDYPYKFYIKITCEDLEKKSSNVSEPIIFF
jgi:hypothetical protein